MSGANWILFTIAKTALAGLFIVAMVYVGPALERRRWRRELKRFSRPVDLAYRRKPRIPIMYTRSGDRP